MLLPCCGILSIENGAFVNRNEPEHEKCDTPGITRWYYEISSLLSVTHIRAVSMLTDTDNNINAPIYENFLLWQTVNCSTVEDLFWFLSEREADSHRSRKRIIPLILFVFSRRQWRERRVPGTRTRRKHRERQRGWSVGDPKGPSSGKLDSAFFKSRCRKTLLRTQRSTCLVGNVFSSLRG